MEKSDSQLDRAMNRGDGLGTTARALELGHAHAAKPRGGNWWSIFSQPACFHHAPLCGFNASMSPYRQTDTSDPWTISAAACATTVVQRHSDRLQLSII